MKSFLLFIILQSFSSAILTEERHNSVNTSQETNIFKPLINYNSAVLEAKKANKKLLIFFTGDFNIPSIRMEEEVFVDITIKSLLLKDFVCFKAVVDDRTELLLTDQYFSKVIGKKVSTIGEKFQDLQLSKFKADMQPYFVILDHNEKLVRQRKGSQNKKEFTSFIHF